MTAKIPELDGLRAIAVLAVIVFHFAYFQLVPGGYLGVDLFFVLSGFLITSLLMAEEGARHISLRDFYARRALRIIPPLLAAVLLALVFVPSTTWKGAFAALFFAANMVDTRVLGGLMHTWSIAVEEHFYFAWPLLFIALGRWRMRALAWTILVVLAVRIVLLIMKQADVYTATYTRADSLAVGCCAAMLLARSRPELPRWAAPLGLAAIAACFLIVPWGSFAMRSFGFTLFAILCATVIVALMTTRSVANDLLSWGPMQYAGRRSYGLYLYHMPALLATEPYRIENDANNLALVTVARVVLTFGIAEISYRTIEAWSRRYAARFRAHRSVAPLAAGASALAGQTPSNN